MITNNAPDFSTLNLVATDGTVTLLESLFDIDARKLRCEGALCAITYFDDALGQGAVQFLIWDGFNAPVFVGDPIPVGDGPVGIDPLTLTDGTQLWVSTGFNDHTISLTHVMSTGELIDSVTEPAPTGCLSPAHGAFYVPDGIPEQAQVAVTCFDSNQWGAGDVVFDDQDRITIDFGAFETSP